MSNLHNDFNNNVKTYFKDIKDYKPISKKEELKMMDKIKAGDQYEKNRLIQSHLKYVVYEAKKYKGRGVSFDDLISEGNMGLLKAIDRYDHSMGNKFISYAVWWVKQSMKDAIKDKNCVLCKELPFDDISVGDSDDGVSYYEETIFDKTSAYDLCDEENTEADMIRENKSLILRLLGDLDEREKEVITKYYNLNNLKEHTLEEIGKEMGLTKVRVNKIREKAISKMRSSILMINDLKSVYE